MNEVIISRDVVFQVTLIPYLKTEIESSDQAQPASTHVEVEQHEDQLEQDIEDFDEATSDLRNYRLARDKQRRSVKLPDKYKHSDMVSYTLSITDELEYHEPKDNYEVINLLDKERRITTMQEEIESLLKNETQVLIDKPRLQKLVSCKWIFKRKVEVSVAGEQIKYKARLVARGFTHMEGIAFNEVQSPLVKQCSIKILLSVVNHFKKKLQQLDVKTVFLHGDLEESIFMTQPEGFILLKNKDKVCLLKRSLYGFKQSPRQLYLKFDKCMIMLVFVDLSITIVYTIKSLKLVM